MRWRLGGARLTEVRTKAGELVAMTAVDPKNGLLSDLHVVDEVYVEAALTAAAGASPSRSVKVMVLPQFSLAVERLHCVDVDHELLFACWSLDETAVASDSIAPLSWLPMHAD